VIDGSKKKKRSVDEKRRSTGHKSGAERGERCSEWSILRRKGRKRKARS
jgi:hypothetical protein